MSSWLERLFGTNKPNFRRHDRGRARALRVESLESRQMLATLPLGFQADLITGGLYEPTAMAVAPDGRIFVTEKPFGVRIVENGQLLDTPFVTLPIEREGERGVGGIVLDPQFDDNGFVYVYYTRLEGNRAFDRLSRFTASTLDPNVADPNSERVLIDDIPTFSPGYHNGGVLQFGADGLLYLGIGDTLDTSLVQDLSKLQGKVLRINPAGFPNVVPSDNPFVSTPGARGEIWATGFRNPFTGQMLPGTSRLFVNDVGSGSFEEINEVVRGGNYGWPLVEGAGGGAPLVDPVYAYPHAGQGAAITGGSFYTGDEFPPSYLGRYFFSDYVQGFVRTFDRATGQASDFATDFAAPVDIANAPDGNLYVASLGAGSDYNGEIHLVRYVGDNRAPTAVAMASATAGQAPLTVHFDASASSDPDGDVLEYAWDFGDEQTATGPTATHTYDTVGTYTVLLTVSDGQTSRVSEPIVVTVGNSSPSAAIGLPVVGTTFRAGDTIQFSGSATDPEEGPLPESGLEWSVVFHHNTHIHPFLEPIVGVGTGSFQIPLVGEADPDQWYRLSLTATDAGGLRHTTFVDIHPVTSNFTLGSNIAGAALLLDGRPVVSGQTVTGVVGMTRAIGAPARQLINGRMYKFVGWSDGGPMEHTIATPEAATNYIAQYQAMPLAAVYSNTAPRNLIVGKKLSYKVTATNVGTQTWSASGGNRVVLGVYFGGQSDAVGAWLKAPVKFPITRNIAPGKSFTFTVKITAPFAAGEYVLRHRLLKGASTWFDTLDKLTTSVGTLVATYASNPSGGWAAGQTQPLSITVTNTGAATWKSAGADRVRLGVYFGGSSDTPGSGLSAPARFELPHDVPPGESASLLIGVKAPTKTGKYTLRARLVHEQAGWFGTMLRMPASVERLRG